MPIIHHDAGDGIPECFLLLIEPHWSAGVRVTYRRTSKQAEGLSGIEDRAPAQRANRLRLEFRLRMTAQEAADLRGMLATLGGLRIGVPLWPDADRPAWVHAPKSIISWTDGGSYAILAPSAELPHPHNAPLLIGRLVERPTIEAQEPFDTTIAIEEDSPWENRIDPAAGVVAASFTWQPNWTKLPVDQSRDQLRVLALGQGREAGVAGADGTPRWGQKAGFTLDRDEAAGLLRFWSDRDGAVRSFAAPAWCRPGEDTPQTPHTLTARFDKDFVELTFLTPEVATCELMFWQEVSLDGGATQSSDSIAHLYVIVTDGLATQRFTSWEHALVHGGNTYQPAKIAHDGLRNTLSPAGDECSVSTFSEWPENPFQPFVGASAERRIRCEVHEARVNAAGAVVRVDELISGEIRSFEHRGDKIVGKLAGFGGVFSRRLPRFYVQRGCNYVFGDANCKLAKADFARPGTLGGGLPSTVVAFTPDVAPPAGDFADKWFAGGWVEVTGTDGKFERRAILDCSAAGGVWTLILNRFLPATCAGRPATAFPGDNGNYSTCRFKFNNGDNFGGHPFAPAFIATSDGDTSSRSAK